MKLLRDVLGIVLILAGVGGVMVGVRGVSGDAWWGGPSIAAGAVANALAYRTIRGNSKRVETGTGDEAKTPRPDAGTT